MDFTPSQLNSILCRGRSVLVSAGAGSGKTAVLAERIVRMISEGDDPTDIDRLLVVTFTKAAAAQMRERIGRAIADYSGFRREGFRTVALFDTSPETIPETGLPVWPVTELEQRLPEMNVAIVVLAVPASEAQASLDRAGKHLRIDGL